MVSSDTWLSQFKDLFRIFQVKNASFSRSINFRTLKDLGTAVSVDPSDIVRYRNVAGPVPLVGSKEMPVPVPAILRGRAAGEFAGHPSGRVSLGREESKRSRQVTRN